MARLTGALVALALAALVCCGSVVVVASRVRVSADELMPALEPRFVAADPAAQESEAKPEAETTSQTAAAAPAAPAAPSSQEPAAAPAPQKGPRGPTGPRGPPGPPGPSGHGVASQNSTDDMAGVDERIIVKSKSDKRFYRRINLPNGLDVLLISDATTTKAAAAMDVNVGYWADPADIPGLAHFCEHMLFLGNKKYPEEDAYSGFLSSHGGSSNAFTAHEETNFYFDIQPEHFPEALDRFAQFFVSPTFDQSATDREMHAVESEHNKNLQSDTWRNFQLLKSLSNPAIAFSKFGTGSTATLGAVPPERLRAALLAYWRQHYVAPNMRLVVLSREKLSTLESMVVNTFRDLPVSPGVTKPNPWPVHDRSAELFPADVKGSVIHAQSVKNTRELYLIWSIPPQTRNYAKKSLDFISTLLGGEGKGSLLSVLKSKGLVRGLTAGPDLSTGQFDLFQVEFELTERGIAAAAITDIITHTYEYLSLIEREGVEEWRWNEQAAISAIHFRLKNKEPAQSYVSSVASDMAKFHPHDLLMANYLYRKFDPADVKHLLGLLVPKEMVVLITAQKPSETLDKTEKWYGTKYAVSRLPSSQLVAWSEARTQPTPKLPAALKRYQLELPVANPFIPRSLEIKPPVNTGVNSKDKNDTSANFPVIIRDVVDVASHDSGSVRVWYRQDNKFARPRVNTVCKMWSASLYATPQDVVLSSLYTQLVRDMLQELTYPAAVAGFSFSFTADVDGLDLNLAGYDDGITLFAREVVRYLMLVDPNRPDLADQRGFLPSRQRFQLVKEGLQQSYDNFMYGQPHVHAAYAMSLLLENPHYHVSEYRAAIQHLELEDVIAWVRNLYQDVGLECLVHGNIYKKEALGVVDEIVRGINFRSNGQALRSISNQVQRVSKVEGSFTFTKRTPNPEDDNSAAYTYFQAGPGNTATDVLTSLLAMVMDKPAFHQLRTVEQLGYIVWSGTDVREGVNGIRIIVQSPTRLGSYLSERIDAFVAKLRNIVHKLSHDEFATFRSSLMRVKLQKSRTLSEETGRYWYEISTQQYKFERRELEVERLKNITQAEFVQFFDDLIGQDGIPNRITVEVNSLHPQPVPASAKLNTTDEHEASTGGATKDAIADKAAKNADQVAVHQEPSANQTANTPEGVKARNLTQQSADAEAELSATKTPPSEVDLAHEYQGDVAAQDHGSVPQEYQGVTQLNQAETAKHTPDNSPTDYQANVAAQTAHHEEAPKQEEAPKEQKEHEEPKEQKEHEAPKEQKEHEEPKQEEHKEHEEPKQEEPKQEEPKQEEPKQETETETEEEPKQETESETEEASLLEMVDNNDSRVLSAHASVPCHEPEFRSHPACAEESTQNNAGVIVLRPSSSSSSDASSPCHPTDTACHNQQTQAQTQAQDATAKSPPSSAPADIDTAAKKEAETAGSNAEKAEAAAIAEKQTSQANAAAAKSKSDAAAQQAEAASLKQQTAASEAAAQQAEAAQREAELSRALAEKARAQQQAQAAAQQLAHEQSAQLAASHSKEVTEAARKAEDEARAAEVAADRAKSEASAELKKLEAERAALKHDRDELAARESRVADAESKVARAKDYERESAKYADMHDRLAGAEYQAHVATSAAEDLLKQRHLAELAAEEAARREAAAKAEYEKLVAEEHAAHEKALKDKSDADKALLQRAEVLRAREDAYAQHADKLAQLQIEADAAAKRAEASEKLAAERDAKVKLDHARVSAEQKAEHDRLVADRHELDRSERRLEEQTNEAKALRDRERDALLKLKAQSDSAKEEATAAKQAAEKAEADLQAREKAELAKIRDAKIQADRERAQQDAALSARHAHDALVRQKAAADRAAAEHAHQLAVAAAEKSEKLLSELGHARTQYSSAKLLAERAKMAADRALSAVQTCNRTGPPRWHAPTKITLQSIARFKNGLCLFPRRPVGRIFMPAVMGGAHKGAKGEKKVEEKEKQVE